MRAPRSGTSRTRRGSSSGSCSAARRSIPRSSTCSTATTRRSGRAPSAHDVIVRPFALASRPIGNADVLAFIADGGYREPRLWLSDGWHAARSEDWQAPLYWLGDGSHYTLAGVRELEPAATACHLSYYE